LFCNKREAVGATITRERGLNTDAYKGPLFRTHHEVTIFPNTVTTIPCHKILVPKYKKMLNFHFILQLVNVREKKKTERERMLDRACTNMMKIGNMKKIK